MSIVLPIGLIFLLKNLEENFKNENQVEKNIYIRKINSVKVKKNISNKQYKLILDIRSYDDYINGHIPDSIHINNINNLKNNINNLIDNLNQKYNNIKLVGKENKSFILVICKDIEKAKKFGELLSKFNIFYADYLLGKDFNIWKKKNSIVYNTCPPELSCIINDKRINYILPNTTKNLLKMKFFDLVIDVRTIEEYNKGHLNNSILLESLATNPNNINLINKKINKNKKILIYCRSGNRSQRAASIFIDNGFTKIYALVDGGYKDLKS